MCLLTMRLVDIRLLRSFLILGHLTSTLIQRTLVHTTTMTMTGSPKDEHDSSHHQADTHSHFAWYTHANGKIVLHVASSALAFDMMVVCPSVAVTSALSRYSYAHAPPARGLPLSLQWSVLRI